MWITVKSSKVYIISLKTKVENGTKAVFENMLAETFPKFIKDLKPLIEEVLQIPLHLWIGDVRDMGEYTQVSYRYSQGPLIYLG